MNITGRQFWLTAAILALGVAAGTYIAFSGGHGAMSGHDEHGGDHKDRTVSTKGPHGGRMLTDGDFSVEITIFEKGVPPELRVYAFEKGKPLNPAEVELRVNLARLGAQPESFAFRARQDYLRGDRKVEEPHSFTVEVAAVRGGRTYRWQYEQAEGRVRMDDATASSSGIRIEAAKPARIRSTLKLQGEIQLNQDRVVRVIPRLGGAVAGATKNLGDRVRRGEVVAVVLSQALGELKSEYLAAGQRLALARTTFEREKRLWEEKISAEQDYLTSRHALAEAEIVQKNAEQKLAALGLQAPGVRLDDPAGWSRFEIRSPIDGVVIEKLVATGEAVGADTTIYVIADLSSVWAEMAIYPSDLGAVKLGQTATVHAAALNASAVGTIFYVGPLVGEQSRTARARVSLPNPGERWRPGLFVTIEVVQDEAEAAVTVPLDAIQTLRDWKVVFARFGDTFEARPVELGRSDGERIEILKGLAAGDRFAAANSFVLKADLGKAGASHDH